MNLIGGDFRSQCLALLKPGNRLNVASNAASDWAHQIARADVGKVTCAGPWC